MDEQGFLEAMKANPHDPDLPLVYADWLEDHGREEEALAVRVRQRVGAKAQVFTRSRAEAEEGYDARLASRYFSEYPGLQVVVVGYEAPTKLGFALCSPSVRPIDLVPGQATTPILYHRKQQRGKLRSTQVVFVRPAEPRKQRRD